MIRLICILSARHPRGNEDLSSLLTSLSSILKDPRIREDDVVKNEARRIESHFSPKYHLLNPTMDNTPQTPSHEPLEQASVASGIKHADNKKKKQPTAIAPLLGILIIIAGIILIPSLYDSYNISTIDKDTASSQLQNTETRRANLDTEYGTWNKAPSTEKTSMLAKIPESKTLGQAAVLKELETTAGSTGTSIVNIGFREANDEADTAFGAEEIALSITGSQEKALLGFVDTLEKAPRLYHIQSFTINKTDSGLTGDIRALLYYHKN